MVKRIVITGGPGSGKTTLVNELEKRGFTISEEVSRKLIRQEAAKPTGVLPWKNLPAFADIALQEMKAEWEKASSKSAIVFYDRGIPDIAAYLACAGIQPREQLAQMMNSMRYEDAVCWCPPWPEIFVNDPERPQNFNESVKLGQTLRKVYEENNYSIIEVPKVSLYERVDFVESLVADLA